LSSFLTPRPNGDNGQIPVQRYAQSLAVKEPLVAMAVAADVGDQAGPFHPIHPPNKQEVARRMFLGAQKFIFGDATPMYSFFFHFFFFCSSFSILALLLSSAYLLFFSYVSTGPTPVEFIVEKWNSNWGNYHFGTGSVNLCQYMHCMVLLSACYNDNFQVLV
jgi:hypothetical protein